MKTGDAPETRLSLLGLLGQVNPVNEGAWNDFFASYQPLILAWARRQGLQGTDAEEVASRVLAKLVRAMPKFVLNPGRGRFRNWLFTVVRNEVFDFLDALRRQPGHRGAGDSVVRDLLENVASDESLNDLVDSCDRQTGEAVRLAREALDRVRAKVEERTWQAFWQTQAEGRSGAVVAAELGMTPSAVFMARSRVKKMLGQALDELKG